MIKPFKHANRVFLSVIAIVTGLTFTMAAEKKSDETLPQQLAQNVATNQLARRELGLEALEEAWAEQNSRVRALEAEANGLRKKLGLTAVSSEAELYASFAETIKKIETERLRALQEYVQFEQLHQSLRAKERKELIQMLPTAYRDALLDNLIETLTKAEQQLAIAERGLGAANPEVQKQTALVKRIAQQINERVDGVLAGLEALTAARQAVARSLDDRLADVKKMEASSSEEARPYFEALRNLEGQRKIRDALFARILQEKVEQAYARR